MNYSHNPTKLLKNVKESDAQFQDTPSYSLGQTPPPTKFHGNLLCSFYIILITKKLQTHTKTWAAWRRLLVQGHHNMDVDIDKWSMRMEQVAQIKEEWRRDGEWLICWLTATSLCVLHRATQHSQFLLHKPQRSPKWQETQSLKNWGTEREPWNTKEQLFLWNRAKMETWR